MFDSLTLPLVFGLVLTVFACMLLEWLPEHMEQQEAEIVNEILSAHASGKDGISQATEIRSEKFWQLPKLTILSMACATCSLLAVSLAFYTGSIIIQSLHLAIWFVGLVVLAFVDSRTKLLPDMLTLPLLWLGIVIQLFPETRTVGLELSVIGAVAGYLPLWLLAQAYRFIRGRDGLGMGDLKLLAAMGAWSGPFVLPQVLLLAALLAIAVFVLERVIRRSSAGFHDERPFGPAIVAAYFIVLLFTL
jgi:prepilin signal peptidase PulO-like enzyme (type II secretory pathway)